MTKRGTMSGGNESQFPRASPAPGDVRCEACGALLARIEAGGLCIRRGDLEASIQGRFQAHLTCYRPRCKRRNRVQVTTER